MKNSPLLILIGLFCGLQVHPSMSMDKSTLKRKLPDKVFLGQDNVVEATEVRGTAAFLKRIRAMKKEQEQAEIFSLDPIVPDVNWEAEAAVQDAEEN